jgi:hypothetical protein
LSVNFYNTLYTTFGRSVRHTGQASFLAGPLGILDLAKKDARYAQYLANEIGVQMKNIELAYEYLKSVKEYIGTRGGVVGIYGAERAEAGLKFEN